MFLMEMSQITNGVTVTTVQQLGGGGAWFAFHVMWSSVHWSLTSYTILNFSNLKKCVTIPTTKEQAVNFRPNLCKSSTTEVTVPYNFSTKHKYSNMCDISLIDKSPWPTGLIKLDVTVQ
jgi:hypothetical protein